MQTHRRGSSFILSSRESSDGMGSGAASAANTGSNTPFDMLGLGLNLDGVVAPPKSPFASPLVTPSKSPRGRHSLTPTQMNPQNGGHTPNFSTGSSSALANNGRFIMSASDGFLMDSPRSNKSAELGNAHGAYGSNNTNFSSDGSGRTTAEENSVSSADKGAAPQVVTAYKLVPLRRSNSSNKDGSSMELFSAAALNNNANNNGGSAPHFLSSGARSNSDLASMNKQQQQAPTQQTSNRPTTAVSFLRRQADGEASQQQQDYGYDQGKKASGYALPKRELASAHSHAFNGKGYGTSGIASEKESSSSSSPNPREYKATKSSSTAQDSSVGRNRSNTAGADSSSASYMNPVRRGDADHKRHSTPHNVVQPLFDTSSPVQTQHSTVYDYSVSSSPSPAGNGNRVRSQSTNPAASGGRVRFL